MGRVEERVQSTQPIGLRKPFVLHLPNTLSVINCLTGTVNSFSHNLVRCAPAKDRIELQRISVASYFRSKISLMWLPPANPSSSNRLLFLLLQESPTATPSSFANTPAPWSPSTTRWTFDRPKSRQVQRCLPSRSTYPLRKC